MHRGKILTPQLQQSRIMSKSASSSLGSCSVRQNHGTQGIFHTSSKMPSLQKQDPEKRTSHPQPSQRQLHDALREHSSKTNETLRTMLQHPPEKLPRRRQTIHSFQHAYHSTSSHSWTSTLHSPSKSPVSLPCEATEKHSTFHVAL